MQVNVNGSMFNPKETNTKQNRNILRSELNIDTNNIIPMFSKNKPIQSTPIYICLFRIPLTMFIRLLAITCDKNSNNPIEIVPVNAQYVRTCLFLCFSIYF